LVTDSILGDCRTIHRYLLGVKSKCSAPVASNYPDQTKKFIGELSEGQPKTVDFSIPFLE
jgi:hypothetical protein